MKKNLFTKFLALFLTGTMLVGVGCKDYDDDIDGLNNRLDELITGKVATLEQQTAKIESALNALESADAALGKRIDALKSDVDKNKTEIGKLTSAQTTLRNDIDAIKGNYVSSTQLESTLTAYSTTQQIANTYATLEKLGALGDLTVKQAIDKAKEDAISAAGAAFEENFKGKFEGELELAMTGEGVLAQTLKEYDEKITTAIANSIKEGGVVTKEIASQLSKALLPLEERLSALEDRIQSLVFAPESLTELENGISFSSADFVMDGKEKVYLGEATGRTADLRFQVTPASIVSKLTAKNVSIKTEEVTRAGAAAFEVTNVEVENAAKGLFIVSVKTEYDYTDAEKTLIIALNVKMDGAKDKQGIDFTSAYIATKSVNGSDVSSKLVLGMEDKEQKIVEISGNYATEQMWNDKTVHNFFPSVALYYKNDNKYELASKKWNNLTFEVKAPAATAKATFEAGSGTGEAKDYTLENTSFTIKNSVMKLIGNTITSSDYVFNMTIGEFTKQIAKIKEVVTIVGTNEIFEAAEAANVVWNYVAATSNDTYVSKEVLLKQGLLGETYSEMAGLTPDVELLDAKNVKVTTPVATLALTSTPDDASTTDTEKVKVTLTGKLPASGNYTLKAVYTLANKTTVTLSIPVVVDGMPKLDDQTITVTSTYAAGTTQYLIQKDYAKMAWKAEWKDKYFADEAAFVAAIEAMTAQIKADESTKATLAIDGKNLMAIYTGAEKGKVYTPSVTFTDAKISDLKLTYKTNVGIAFPDAVMTPDAAFNGGAPIVIAGFTADDAYKTTGLDLSQIYSYKGDVAGVKVVYSVDDKAAADKGAMVTNGNILDWGTYSETKIAMKAELLLDNYVLQTVKDFMVALPDPIKESKITIDTKKTTLYASKEADVTLDIASLLTLKATNDANVFSVAAGNNNGLDADLYTALCKNRKDVGVTYKLVNIVNKIGVVDYDEATRTVKVDKIVDLLDGFDTVTVNVKVLYTYWFGTREVIVPIEVKPSTAKPTK